ncbi:MAG: hypothetical protein JWN70_2500 [Planctomycetaceae bacterium]|nr:hypothetical protein [Planctomycetaceae bacterium]
MQKYLMHPQVVFTVYLLVVIAAMTGLLSLSEVSIVTTANEVIYTFPLYVTLGYGALGLLSTVVVPWLIRNDPQIPHFPMIGRYLLLLLLASWGMTLLKAGSSFRVGQQSFQHHDPISAVLSLKHQYNYAQLQTISLVHSNKSSNLVMRIKGQPEPESFRTDGLVLAGLAELKKQATAQGVTCAF